MSRFSKTAKSYAKSIRANGKYRWKLMPASLEFFFFKRILHHLKSYFLCSNLQWILDRKLLILWKENWAWAREFFKLEGLKKSSSKVFLSEKERSLWRHYNVIYQQQQVQFLACFLSPPKRLHFIATNPSTLPLRKETRPKFPTK